jgi:DNA-binding NarL/FixJ family response regulator
MPKLNGFQAGRTIHGAVPKLPLLLLTQHNFETQIEREARDFGFSGAVTKGSYDLLIDGIESLLRGETFCVFALTPALNVATNQVIEPEEQTKAEGALDGETESL